MKKQKETLNLIFDAMEVKDQSPVRTVHFTVLDNGFFTYLTGEYSLN